MTDGIIQETLKDIALRCCLHTSDLAYKALLIYEKELIEKIKQELHDLGYSPRSETMIKLIGDNQE